MTTIQDLIDDTLLNDVDEAITSITGGKPGIELVDLGFIKVGVKTTSTIETLVRFIAEHAKPGGGAFQDMSLDDLAGGPSYIALGAWIGDQTQALIFMALGKRHGAWDIISPTMLGMDLDDPEARELMGLGFLMTSGLEPGFRALVEAEMVR